MEKIIQKSIFIVIILLLSLNSPANADYFSFSRSAETDEDVNLSVHNLDSFFEIQLDPPLAPPWDLLLGKTFLASKSSADVQGNGVSDNPSITPDGRYIAFSSGANNLVSGDTNSVWDIFVYDRQYGQIELVSISTSGTQGNGNCWGASISSDGNYVVFTSLATNLVTGDTNGYADVFMHNRSTGETKRVSVSTNGDEGDGAAFISTISANGEFIVFDSYASNMVSADTNGTWDIFVYDMATEITTLVSVATDGTQGNRESYYPSVSANGEVIAFESAANNLVSGDSNNTYDIFLHDIQTGETSLVSASTAGIQGNGSSRDSSISADGLKVTFTSFATDLIADDTNGAGDVFLKDLTSGNLSIVSISSAGVQGNALSESSSISSDGRYIAFSSEATNLFDSDSNAVSDVFIFDTQTSQTNLVSISSFGDQGNQRSSNPAVSQDGTYVAYGSDATNLITSDTNEVRDVFFQERIMPEIDIKGNNIVIPDGDLTPVEEDGTDFGEALAASGSVTHEFVIYNNGVNDLILDDDPIVWVTGVHAADFSVTVQPDSTIVPGGNSSFSVQFSPSGYDVRLAEISISNNDSNENPYVFSIQGTGTGSTLLDDYEPDNSFSQAAGITSGETQIHSISPTGDVDWLTFTLTSESGIILETLKRYGYEDTVMWLYDSELNQVAYDDNSGDSNFSMIKRSCLIDPLPAGTYYAKIQENGNDESIGYDVNLKISLCGVELLKNPSYEVFAPDYWGSAYLVMGVDGNDCTNKHGGICSGKMIGNGTNKQFRYVTLADIHVGDSLNLSFWSKSQTAEGIYFAKVVLYNTVDASTQEVMVVPNKGTHNWEQYSSGTFTANGTYNRIRIYLLGSRSGTVWYDDASMLLNGTEMIKGPGFEVFIPDLWQSLYLNGQVDGPDTGIVHSGSLSGRMVGDGGTKQYRNVVIVDMEAGDAIQFSFWTRSQNASTKYFARVVFYNTVDKRTQSTMVVPAQGTNDWTYYTSGVIIADGAYDRVRLYLLGPGSGTAWYDDISLTQ